MSGPNAGNDFKTRVLQAIDIVELIGLSVSLKRRGKDYIDDPWELAEADSRDLAASLGTDANGVRGWIERARLATLRGIGAEGASRLESIGITSVEDLAEVDPESVARRLSTAGAPVQPARVRVWVRAARETARQR